MERVGRIFDDPRKASAAEPEEMWALTPLERTRIARILRERVYGPAPADVRESERARTKA